MIFPLFRDQLLIYLESKNIMTTFVDRTAIPGVENYMDYFGIISYMLYGMVVIMLNTILINDNKKLLREKNYSTIISLGIGFAIYSSIFLIVGEYLSGNNIIEIFRNNNKSSMIPLLFIFMLTDYIIFRFSTYNNFYSKNTEFLYFNYSRT
jgi:hypothetical protein